MTSITIDNLKAHLNITGEQDDIVLGDVLEAAEDWVLGYTGASYETAEMPASLKQAIRMLAGHLFENREATLIGVSASELPFGVLDLITPHREWAF